MSGALSRREFLGAAGSAAGFGLSGLAARRRNPAGGRRIAYAAHRPTPRTTEGPPPVTATTPANGTAPGRILLTPTESDDYADGPLIVDNFGHVIWFLPVDDSVTNLQVQTYKGQPVLTWWQGDIVLPGYGVGSYEIYDTNYDQVTTVSAGNGLSGDLHEFVLTPQGTALLSAYRVQPRDLSPVGGPSNGQILNSLFQEVDVATGKVLFEWSAGDHVRLEESYRSVPHSSSMPYDFFHINSICVDTDGNYLVSSRHCCCIFKIDSTTGKVIWRLHGKFSDFVMEPGSRFYWQHHARRTPAGDISIFDDGATTARHPETQSRGLIVSADTTKWRCKMVAEYLPSPSISSTSQGSMELLPNGNAFVGWGNEPVLSEYSPSGKLIFQATLPSGINSYRAFRSRWPGATVH